MIGILIMLFATAVGLAILVKKDAVKKAQNEKNFNSPDFGIENHPLMFEIEDILNERKEPNPKSLSKEEFEALIDEIEKELKNNYH